MLRCLARFGRSRTLLGACAPVLRPAIARAYSAPEAALESALFAGEEPIVSEAVYVASDDYIYSREDQHGPFKRYKAARLDGTFRADPRQEVLVDLLQNLYSDLYAVLPRSGSGRGLTMIDPLCKNPPRPARSWWDALSDPVQDHSAAADMPRGLYVYGGVGSGKTMLMDLFSSSVPRSFKCLRTHYHEFMLGVHEALNAQRGSADPVAEVAVEMARRHRVLCLDEFFVTDVADAAILSRLFTALWESGVVLVATSNRAPDALYEGGLQRHLFLPFIDKLKERSVVLDMASPVDHRQAATAAPEMQLLLWGPDRDVRLDAAWRDLTAGERQHAQCVEVAMGRSLTVPRAVGRSCRFTFQQLCGAALAAADYLSLAGHFHTVCLDGVPQFDGAARPAAYRFVTLIDVLYEHRMRFLCSSDVDPQQLFANVVLPSDARGRELPPSAVVDSNLGFAKDRTLSRLMEMQSSGYLIGHAKRHRPYVLPRTVSKDMRSEE